jgi:hypothetical protein
MLESEVLRKNLGDLYGIDLEKYKWNETLEKEIFSIDLDDWYEEKISTLKMQEIYEKGLNIGRCGLTSRYFAIHFPNAVYHRGKCSILVGTKNAEHGEHAWITREEDGTTFIYDSTLMLKIPESVASKYYTTERILDNDSARILSEYETYSNDEMFYPKKTR